MNLKNYTSVVPAFTSMSRIERHLVQAGASDIAKKYDSEKACTSITFRIVVNNIPVFFQVTAKVQACFKVLYSQVKRPQSDTKKKILAQAEMTAWKIISDWVEIQMSMVQLEQADIIQVFLPFVYNPESDKTFYDSIKDGGYKQLTNGK